MLLTLLVTMQLTHHPDRQFRGLKGWTWGCSMFLAQAPRTNALTLVSGFLWGQRGKGQLTCHEPLQDTIQGDADSEVGAHPSSQIKLIRSPVSTTPGLQTPASQMPAVDNTHSCAATALASLIQLHSLDTDNVFPRGECPPRSSWARSSEPPALRHNANATAYFSTWNFIPQFLASINSTKVVRTMNGIGRLIAENAPPFRPTRTRIQPLCRLARIHQ